MDELCADPSSPICWISSKTEKVIQFLDFRFGLEEYGRVTVRVEPVEDSGEAFRKVLSVLLNAALWFFFTSVKTSM